MQKKIDFTLAALKNSTINGLFRYYYILIFLLHFYYILCMIKAWRHRYGTEI